MEKNDKNQYVGSIFVISTVFLVAASILSFAPAWNSASKEKIEKTTHRAESLAYQVLEAQKAAQGQQSLGRSPASVESALGHLNSNDGEIGSDEWGRPYHFSSVLNSEGQKLILVWSNGPDGKSQINPLTVTFKNSKLALTDEGDDIAVVIPY